MIVRLLCFFLVTGIPVSTLLGQSTPAEESEPPTSAEVPVSRQVSVSMVPSGIQRYSAGHWGAIALVGANLTDQDAEETVSIYIGEDSGNQFSRRFWVPAGSKRQTWVPIHVPESIPKRQTRADLSMMRLVDTPTGEVLTNHGTGEAILKRSVMLTPLEVNTALVTDPKNLEQVVQLEEEGNRLRSFVDLARDSVGSQSADLPLITMNANFIPPTHEALQDLDQMVIAGDGLAGDTVGMDSVRQWLRSGGRLWVMLDRVSPMMVDQLLGLDASFEMIHRVQLNDYQMEMRNARATESADTIQWSSERPADLMRIVTKAEEIAYSIDDWPAAFWLPVGDGEVLMTTLSLNGWTDDRGVVTPALGRLSRRFFESRQIPMDRFEAMKPLLDDQIGYQIPQRALVAGILIGNVVLILLLGIWWAKERRLERFAIALPVLSLVSALIFIAMARQSTRAIPSTIATTQLVSVDRGAGQMDVVAGHAVYSQESGGLGSISMGDTVVLPRGVESSESFRLSIEDGVGARLKGAELRPGTVRYFESKTTLAEQQPFSIRGTFDSEGFSGSLDGIEDRVFEDAFVAAPRVPALELVLTQQGNKRLLRGPYDQLFVRGQFISGRLLSDQQRLRQQFMQHVFSDLDRYPFSEQPVAVFWTDALGLGGERNSQFESTGSAAIAAPIELRRPEAGDSFMVPATFIQLETVAGDDGISSIYNPRTGRWLKDVTKANSVDFLARFPEVIAGMEVEQLTITIKINAPTRSLLVKSLVKEKPTTMLQSQSPTGTIRCVIDQREALQWYSENRLWFQIAVTGSTDTGQTQESREAYQISAEEVERRRSQSKAMRAREANSVSWTIEDVHVEAKGRLLK